MGVRTDERLTAGDPRLRSLDLFQEVGAMLDRLPAGVDLEPWATLSGHEPNNLFLSSRGRRFADLSGLSGMDHEGDARGLVVWDYDRDGGSDLALINANAPRLQVFRNLLVGQRPGQANRFVALRFVGGNHTAKPSARWSVRDGYGARATLTVGGEQRRIDHHCGTGFAAQNSTTRLVGLGGAEEVEALEVVWPSGKVQTGRRIPAGSLVTVYEDASQSPAGDGFEIEPYSTLEKVKLDKPRNGP